MKSLREDLADQCHRSWTSWMEYLFECAEIQPDGDLLLSASRAKMWLRKMRTSYEDLPTNEQESDRVEADKFLYLVTRRLE